MHIAICDDNIADRKHLERLLSRESDKRAGTPNLLYVDSFGDSKALLNSTPSMYDLLFIDLVETEQEAYQTIDKLLHDGVTSPITMCSSKIDYHTLTNLPENTLHISKPFRVDELLEVLAKAQELKDNKIPTLEMRSAEGTRYIPRDSILYAYPEENSIHVVLVDGENFDIHGVPFEFFENLKPYVQYFIMGQKYVFNVKYILKRNLFSVEMTDHKIIKLSWSFSMLLKQHLKYIKEHPCD